MYLGKAKAEELLYNKLSTETWISTKILQSWSGFSDQYIRIRLKSLYEEGLIHKRHINKGIGYEWKKKTAEEL